jgi:hypothetical protein
MLSSMTFTRARTPSTVVVIGSVVIFVFEKLLFSCMQSGAWVAYARDTKAELGTEWGFHGSAFVFEVDLLLFQETMREEGKSSFRP